MASLDICTDTVSISDGVLRIGTLTKAHKPLAAVKYCN